MDLVQFITESQNKKEFLIIKPEFCHLRNEILDFLKQHHIIPIRELRKTLALSEAKKLYKDDMRNAVHSSDSGLNVFRESQIYFGTPMC